MKSLKSLLVPLLAALVSGGCFMPPPVEDSIPSRFYDRDDGQNEELIIFLPGRGDDLDVFEREGMLDIVSRNADLIALDAHLGYYLNGLLAERAGKKVFEPFQAKGYKRFIVVGTSLGGFGALWLNHEFDELVSGVVLIAPYLGRKPVIKEIQSSESLQSWRAQVSDDPSPGEQAWIWVDALAQRGANANKSIILAYGEKDSFSRAAGLLSKNLPGMFVFKNDGGHNWKTWRDLWIDINASEAWQNMPNDGDPEGRSK